MNPKSIILISLCLLAICQLNAQNKDSISNLSGAEILKLVEKALQEEESQKAIGYLDLYENNLNKYSNHICGNGAVGSHLKRLLLRTKAYNQMGSYDLTIDILLPLIFDENMFSFSNSKDIEEEICSLLIYSLKRIYSDSEIKQELLSCVNNIELVEVENYDTHQIKVFDRVLKLHLFKIYELQSFALKLRSAFYDKEYKYLTEAEAEIRKREIDSNIEEFAYKIYKESVLNSRLHGKYLNGK